MIRTTSEMLEEIKPYYKGVILDFELLTNEEIISLWKHMRTNKRKKVFISVVYAILIGLTVLIILNIS